MSSTAGISQTRAAMFRDGAWAMRWAWRLTFAAAAFDAVAMALSGFTLPPAGGAMSLGCAGAVYAIAWFYRRVRPDEILSALAESASLLIAFTLILAVASYLVTAADMPLHDADYAAFDRLIGFDWMGHQRFIAARPLLANALQSAYELSIPLVALAVLSLALTRNLERLGVFILLFVITAIITIALSGLVPAAGAYVYYQPGNDIVAAIHDSHVGQWHLRHFLALRDGTMRIIPLPFVEGLITFPSFHTQLAVITAWALLGVRYAGGPGLIVNGAVIFSTLGIGGHHLTDVIVGGLIALGAIAAVTGRRALAPQPRMAAPLAA